MMMMPFSKSLLLSLASSFLSMASALDAAKYPFQAPTAYQLRSPCPGLNSLANHGILPRDGREIDLATLASAAAIGFNVDRNATIAIGSAALKTSTTGDPNTFNLDDIAQHKPQVLEHDGSLSRSDFFFGDNLHFSHDAWARTLQSWGGAEVITIDVAATERKARFAYGIANNPDFNATFANTPSLTEYALMLSAFGDPVNGNANAANVKFWFENERLPFEAGWQPPTIPTTLESTRALAGRIGAALAA